MEKLISKILQYIAYLFYGDTIPNPVMEEPIKEEPKVVEEVKPKEELLKRFCKCIAAYEGGPGNRNHRNNNPGNIKAPRKAAISKDKDGFCIYPSWEVGMNDLIFMVRNACLGESKIHKPTETITQFFKVYAPSADHNDPDAYAKWVCNSLGIPTSTQIRELL